MFLYVYTHTYIYGERERGRQNMAIDTCAYMGRCTYTSAEKT